jgi:hypothetical protein
MTSSLFIVNLTGEEGFEPPTPWSVATCSSPLSYTPSTAFNHSIQFWPKGKFSPKNFFEEFL